MDVDTSLQDVLFGKRKVKRFDLNGRKIVLKVLTEGEQSDVLARLRGFSATSFDLYQFRKSKVFTLAKAIESIDGTYLAEFPDVRELVDKKDIDKTEAIETILERLGSPIIDTLNRYYEELLKEYTEEIESLKNDSRDPNQEQSGQSVKPSEKLQKN